MWSLICVPVLSFAFFSLRFPRFSLPRFLANPQNDTDMRVFQSDILIGLTAPFDFRFLSSPSPAIFACFMRRLALGVPRLSLSAFNSSLLTPNSTLPQASTYGLRTPLSAYALLSHRFASASFIAP